MLCGSSVSEGSSLCLLPLPLSATNEFGIQVDLMANPENPQHLNEPEELGGAEVPLTVADRRKLTKKLSKQRKRQRGQEEQRSAKGQIGNIVQEFYEGSSRFEDYATRIQELLEIVYNHDFREYLDELIRMRVTIVQNAIWGRTQQLLRSAEQDGVFFVLIVQQLYLRFLELQESSLQVEKLINVFLRLSDRREKAKEEVVYSNLAGNTFNYLVETDRTLKNLVRMCDRKLGAEEHSSRRKLDELIGLIDCYHQDSLSEEGRSEEGKSEEGRLDRAQPSLCDWREEAEQGQEAPRRRRKIRESELLCEEEAVRSRLDAMVVGGKGRAPCRVSEACLNRMAVRQARYRAF